MTSENTRPPATQPASALEAVRRETAQSHRRLEALAGQARMLSDDYRLPEYRSMLQRTYGYYVPLGAILRAQPHAVAWGNRIVAQAERIQADLLDLGLTEAELAFGPQCAQIPEFDTPDRALGGAYVFEGSTLGGRVILNHLKHVFAGRPDVPFRFFTGDGDAVGSNWRRFCLTLNADAVAIDEVCGAAVAAFASFGAWLDDGAVPALAHESIA